MAIRFYTRLLLLLKKSKKSRLFLSLSFLFFQLLLLLLFSSRFSSEMRVALFLHWPLTAAAFALLGIKRGVIWGVVLGAAAPLLFYLQGSPSFDQQWLQKLALSTAILLLFASPFSAIRRLLLNQKRLNRALEKFARIDPATELVSAEGLRVLGLAEFKKAMRLNDDLSYYLAQHETAPRREDNSKFKETRELKDYLGTLSCAIIAPHFSKAFRKLHGARSEEQLIQLMASRIADRIKQRDTDIIARGEGASLIVLMPNTSARNSIVPLKKLVEKMTLTEFKIGGKEIYITFDGGISELSDHDLVLDDLLDRARRALAIAQGREGGELLFLKSDQTETVLAKLMEEES